MVSAWKRSVRAGSSSASGRLQASSASAAACGLTAMFMSVASLELLGGSSPGGSAQNDAMSIVVDLDAERFGELDEAGDLVVEGPRRRRPWLAVRAMLERAADVGGAEAALRGGGEIARMGGDHQARGRRQRQHSHGGVVGLGLRLVRARHFCA